MIYYWTPSRCWLLLIKMRKIFGFLFCRYSSCDGPGCCRTSITSGLQDYNIDFKPADDEDPSEGCKYAFIAEQQWFGQDPRDLDALQDMNFVPVIIDWTVESSSLTAIGLSASSYGLPYTCDHYSISTNLSGSLYTCYCDMGYLGNALLNNCQGRLGSCR